MKKIFTYLFILFVSLNVYGIGYDDIGIGYNNGGYEDSNYIFGADESPGNSFLYFSLESGGKYHIHFRSGCLYETGSVYLHCLNYTYPSYNWILFNTSDSYVIDQDINTNTGICRLYCENLQHSPKINKTSFYAELISNDYSFLNFTAGGKYDFPTVNRYYPSLLTGRISGLTTTDLNTNMVSGYSLSTFDFNCDAGGEELLFFVNSNLSNYTSYKTYFKNVNVNAYTNLEFLSYYPNLNVYVNKLDKYNFSAVINRPEVLDGAIWYLDGNVVQYGTNLTYEYTQIDDNSHTIELQIEDITCQKFYTLRWNVINKNRISLSGKVIDNNNINVEGAIISLECNSSVLTDITDISGSFSFMDIPAKTYNITIYKNGYKPFNNVEEFKAVSNLTITNYYRVFNISEIKPIKTSLFVFTELYRDLDTPLYNISGFTYREDGIIKLVFSNGLLYAYSGITTSNFDTSFNNSIYIYSENTFDNAEFSIYEDGYKCIDGIVMCNYEYDDLNYYDSVMKEFYFTKIASNETFNLYGYTKDNNSVILPYV